MNPVVLVVMDGVGLRGEVEGNAFEQADTPNLDKLMDEQGFTELEAWGPAVGLPEGYQGNSEVGHLHLGAGRRVPQRMTRINQAIERNKLREKEALRNALERSEENSKPFHIAGIISDGGIHGHIKHLKAVMEITEEYSLGKVWIHCFTDGRDVDPKSCDKFLDQIRNWMDEYDTDFGIASIMGRYYAMDRDNNWDRTEKAYKALALGKGFEFEKPEEALEKTYENGDYDYFVIPSVNQDYEGMTSDDEILFYNFRADREVQIAKALLKDSFSEFDNKVIPNFTSMFRYERSFDNPVLFEKQIVEDTLGEKIEENGFSQLRITESQKIPHVTYFFNGQRELEFEHEDTHFVESDKIKAYDQKPEMHADDITDILVDAISEAEHEFILLNFPNGDLVGHTGDLSASIKAVETVDKNIGRIKEAVKGTDYSLLITADHGNCEDVGTQDDPNTSHTLNPVPLISYNSEIEVHQIVGENELWEVEKVVEDILFN